MTTKLEALRERRTELERRLAEPKGGQAALYTPGISLVPQRGERAPHEIDQEVAELEAAIVELDAEIESASKQA